MRAYALLLMCAACSSSSGTTTTTPEPTDPVEDAGVDAKPEASTHDAAPAVSAGVGNCAGCTANKCGKELQACAGSQECVNGLVAFNDCFGAQKDGTSGTCGTTFASSDAKAAALWSCDEAKCPGECGVKK